MLAHPSELRVQLGLPSTADVTSQSPGVNTPELSKCQWGGEHENWEFKELVQSEL